MPPANRKVLAYHVAANAIMAGCPPAYMPLCIAIVRCFANGNFYKSLASTHGWTPYVLISGPIARQLGFSYEDGMINEEANKLLGRFISLAMLNLAGYKIKENRMGTFGYMQPFAFAEDEQACIEIGWNPYHVEKGYDLNDNIITVTSFTANLDGNIVMGENTDASFITLNGSVVTMNPEAKAGATAVIGAANGDGTYRTMTFINGG